MWVNGIILVAALSLAPSLLYGQFDFKLADLKVQLHSFASEGFGYSNDNNYLTMKTSQGSFAMTDGGVNITVQVTEHFRVGAQGYAENVGQLYKWHPQLDWALADYKFTDWFGVRAGKVKTVLGLYNDTQDMEFLHTWALLPQSIYPIDLRDNFIAHLGGDVYGNIGLRRAGSLSYTGYAGQGSNNTRGGYYQFTNDQQSPIEHLTATVQGFDLRWSTPVLGLQAGTSWMNRDMAVEGVAVPYGGIPYNMETNPQHLTSVYADFTRGRIHLSTEYRRNHFVFRGGVEGMTNSANYGDTSFFASAAYRITKRLELGAYNSRYYGDAQVTSSAASHIFDQTVAARFDITDFWHIKLEGHYIDGYGDLYSAHGFYLGSNPVGLRPTTNLLVLRTGLNF